MVLKVVSEHLILVQKLLMVVSQVPSALHFLVGRPVHPRTQVPFTMVSGREAVQLAFE